MTFQPYQMVTSTITQCLHWPPSIGEAFSIHHVDLPKPGYWKVRMVKKGPWVPLRTWLVEHRDPEDKRLMADPSFMGQRGLDEPSCCWYWRFTDIGFDLTAIPKAEYEYLVALMRHAQKREHDLPEARPDQPVDWLNSAPVL